MREIFAPRNVMLSTIIIAEVLFLLSLFKKIFSTVTRYLSEYNVYVIGNIA